MDRSILIIDDEEGFRKVLSITLADAGYTVWTAERARDGLELFRLHRPDLVITDLIMPGRGGCAAVRTIKEESPDTPVFLLTGLCAPEVRGLCREYPGVVLLRKPVDLHELETAIQGACPPASPAEAAPWAADRPDAGPRAPKHREKNPACQKES